MISVIIPTCDRVDLLRKCLKSLSPEFQRLNSTFYEVIVTDDSKNDDSQILIVKEQGWAKWVKGPKKGPAANRNNGAKYAVGDWLVFVDDDCIPDKELLSEYWKSLKIHKNILVFEGCIKVDREKQSFLEESPVNETGGYLWSCNFMINRKLFEDKIKGFDEQFPYAAMEDVDLHYRLKKNGTNIVFLTKALVIHPWRRQNNIFSQTLNRFTSTMYFISKHPEKSDELNTLYYLKAFYNSIINNTLRNSFRYRFRGFFPKITYDFLQLYFAIYVLRIKYYNNKFRRIH